MPVPPAAATAACLEPKRSNYASLPARATAAACAFPVKATPAPWERLRAIFTSPPRCRTTPSSIAMATTSKSRFRWRCGKPDSARRSRCPPSMAPPRMAAAPCSKFRKGPRTARNSVCAKRVCSTLAPTSAATRSCRSRSLRPTRAMSALASFCVKWPLSTPQTRAPKCGPRFNMARARSKAAYMISAVAEQYEIHPQTLRLYEREGLLKPSRSDGNTRLYTSEDLVRLEVILHLTRDLGVNLAGVEIILNMREKMGDMQAQIQDFIASLNRELAARKTRAPIAEERNCLIPVSRR